MINAKRRATREKEALINEIMEDKHFKIVSKEHFDSLGEILGKEDVRALARFLIQRNGERIANGKDII